MYTNKWLLENKLLLHSLSHMPGKLRLLSNHIEKTSSLCEACHFLQNKIEEIKLAYQLKQLQDLLDDFKIQMSPAFFSELSPINNMNTSDKVWFVPLLDSCWIAKYGNPTERIQPVQSDLNKVQKGLKELISLSKKNTSTIESLSSDILILRKSWNQLHETAVNTLPYKIELI